MASPGSSAEGRHLSGNPDIVIDAVTVLSDGYGTLRSTVFDQRSRDGEWQRLERESYQRGDSAGLLAYDLERRTVLLVRQFRFPVYEHGHGDGRLIEVCAGMLEPGEPAAVTIRREAVEELGVEVGEPTAVTSAYLSPGAMTECCHLFAAPYSPSGRVSAGGGLAEEGEDIEVLELSFDEALSMTGDGRIVDAKTVLLLQWAALRGPFSAR